MDLFFMISGFLIGKILLNSRDQRDYYTVFYSKRIARIFPLAFVMFLCGIILALVLGWNLTSLPYYFLFIQNYIPTQDVVGTDPQWTGHLPGLNTMWSLAVEEHFYLVTPFLIMKLRGVGLPIVLFILSLVSVILKVKYINSHVSYTFFSNPFPTECRVVYLASGMMMNFERSRKKYLGVMILLWITVDYIAESNFGKLDVIAFSTLWLLVVATIDQRLRFRCYPLAWIGIRCYGIYLIHMPITLVLKRFGGDLHPLILMSILIISTLILAEISFRFFEIPASNRISKFFMEYSKKRRASA